MTARPVIAWSLLALTIGCMASAAAMPDDDWPLVAILALGAVLSFTAAVGMVIVVRGGGNRVGWVLIGIGLSVSSGMLATQYANRTFVEAPGSLPFADAVAWLQSWLWSPLTALFALVVLWFPTGHPPSPRWRIVGRAAFALAFLATLSVALRPGPFDTFPNVRNPLGVGVLEGTQRIYENAWMPLLLIVYGGAVASIFVRFRRSRGPERQQLKWFAYAVGGAVVLTLVNPLSIALGLDRLGEWASLVFGPLGPLLAFLLLPLAIGTAILRHRLYDIDRIISRTLSYAVVSAVLGGTFAVVVLVPTGIVGRGHTPDWMVAVATLAVAALFRPLRRRVQDVVDHRFNRRRYDAEHTIDAFALRLREQIDIDALGAELCAVVNTTVQPSRVSLWLAGKP